MKIRHRRSSDGGAVGAGMHVDDIRAEGHMNGGRNSRFIRACEDAVAGEFEMAVGKLSANYFT